MRRILLLTAILFTAIACEEWLLPLKKNTFTKINVSYLDQDYFFEDGEEKGFGGAGFSKPVYKILKEEKADSTRYIITLMGYRSDIDNNEDEMFLFHLTLMLAKGIEWTPGYKFQINCQDYDYRCSPEGWMRIQQNSFQKQDFTVTDGVLEIIPSTVDVDYLYAVHISMNATNNENGCVAHVDATVQSSQNKY